MTDPNGMITITRAELKALIKDGVAEALQEAMLPLGLDISTPSGKLAAQRDFNHLRSWRQATETAKRQGLITAVGIIVAGILGSLLLRYGGGPTN